jgi:hypothetical protein
VEGFVRIEEGTPNHQNCLLRLRMGWVRWWCADVPLQWTNGAITGLGRGRKGKRNIPLNNVFPGGWVSPCTPVRTDGTVPLCDVMSECPLKNPISWERESRWLEHEKCAPKSAQNLTLRVWYISGAGRLVSTMTLGNNTSQYLDFSAGTG